MNLNKYNEKIINIPNTITATRLLCMIPCIFFSFTGNITTAGIWFMIAAATDGIDGFAARKLKQTTKFGANFDAIVDKFIMFGVLPMVILKSPLLIINLIYELAIGLLNSYSTKIKKNNPHTNNIGRKKQVLLCILLAGGYFSNISKTISILTTTLLPITAYMQQITLNEYIKEYKKVEQEKQKLENKKKLDQEKEEEKEVYRQYINTTNKEKEINPLTYINESTVHKTKSIGAKKINR